MTQQFGRWKYRQRSRELDCDGYRISLRECRTEQQRASWFKHLRGKSWFTSGVEADLQGAFSELAGSGDLARSQSPKQSSSS